MTQSHAIRQSLADCKTIAVVGLSPKPHRDSFRVSKYMQDHGFRIVPINPNASEVLGETAYASLTEAAMGGMSSALRKQFTMSMCACCAASVSEA